MPVPPGFDPERHAHRLAPAAAALAAGGLFAGGWAGFVAAAAGLGLVLLACWSARDGFLLVGPHARFLPVRSTRRRYVWALRLAAAGAVLLGACVRLGWASLQSWWLRPMDATRAWVRAGQRLLADYAWGQFTGAVVLAAAGAAAAVAAERVGKRLDLLLTTDLRSREILAGAAGGGWAVLLLTAMAPLPVLALFPILGGLPWDRAAAVAEATAAGVAGATGLGLWASVTQPTPGRAAGRATVVLAGYVLLTWTLAGGGLLVWLPQFARAVGGWEVPTAWGAFPGWVGGVNRVLGAGNPLIALDLAADDLTPGAGADAEFLLAARRFAGFWLGVGLLFGLRAAARLRADAPAAVPAGVTRRTRSPRAAAAAARRRPPVGDDPVAWWQQYGGMSRFQLAAGRAVGWWGSVALGGLVAAGLLAVRAAGDPGLGERVGYVLLRVLGAAAVLGAVAPAGPLGTAFAQEKAAGTLDGLRLTALTAADILAGKRRGAVRLLRPVYGFGAAVGLAGAAAGFVHPIGLLLLAGAVAAGVVGLTGAAAAGGVRAVVPALGTTSEWVRRAVVGMVVGGGMFYILMGAGWLALVFPHALAAVGPGWTAGLVGLASAGLAGVAWVGRRFYQGAVDRLDAAWTQTWDDE